MKFFAILIKLIPFLFSMVRAAEIVIDKEKSGVEKKAAVKEGVTAMFDGAKDVSTGGQKETFEVVDPLFDAIIDKGVDLAATMLFKGDK